MTPGNPVFITTHSARETATLGRFLAHSLKKGQIVGLIGGLGSGKTVLARAIAGALGIRRLIKSPTFVLIVVYRVKNNGISSLFHVDCYRVRRLTETDRAAIMEVIETPRSVTLIEWADRIPALLRRVPERRRASLSLEVRGSKTRCISVLGALTGSARKWATAHPSRVREIAAPPAPGSPDRRRSCAQP